MISAKTGAGLERLVQLAGETLRATGDFSDSSTESLPFACEVSHAAGDLVGQLRRRAQVERLEYLDDYVLVAGRCSPSLLQELLLLDCADECVDERIDASFQVSPDGQFGRLPTAESKVRVRDKEQYATLSCASHNVRVETRMENKWSDALPDKDVEDELLYSLLNEEERADMSVEVEDEVDWLQLAKGRHSAVRKFKSRQALQ